MSKIANNVNSRVDFFCSRFLKDRNYDRAAKATFWLNDIRKESVEANLAMNTSR